MNPKLKNGLLAAICFTLVYPLYLFIISRVGTLPEETQLVKLTNGHVDLPWSISLYWNTLLGPIFMLFLVYCYSMDKIIGKSPNENNNRLTERYKTRQEVSIVSAMSVFMGVGPAVLCAFIQPFDIKGFGGPLTIVTMIIIFSLAFYLMLAIAMQPLMELFDSEISDTYGLEEKTVTEMYVSKLIRYFKIGTIKTLPFMIGLSLAYIIRLLFNAVIKVIKGVRNSFREESVA
jgi:hypothetical protein